MRIKKPKIFEEMRDVLKSEIGKFPDKRRYTKNNVKYNMGDIVMTAFSMFYMQSSSWLSFQINMERGKRSSNISTMFEAKEIATGHL